MNGNANYTECPICMSEILNINFSITECGHSFHSSCLLKNIIHNNCSCPICRTLLVEPKPEPIYHDYNDEDDYDEDDIDTINSSQEANDIADELAFIGFRSLFRQANNEEDYDYDDDYEELTLLPQEVAEKMNNYGVSYIELVTTIMVLENYYASNNNMIISDKVLDIIEKEVNEYEDNYSNNTN